MSIKVWTLLKVLEFAGLALILAIWMPNTLAYPSNPIVSNIFGSLAVMTLFFLFGGYIIASFWAIYKTRKYAFAFQALIQFGVFAVILTCHSLLFGSFIPGGVYGFAGSLTYVGLLSAAAIIVHTVKMRG